MSNVSRPEYTPSFLLVGSVAAMMLCSPRLVACELDVSRDAMYCYHGPSMISSFFLPMEILPKHDIIILGVDEFNSVTASHLSGSNMLR